MPAPKKPTPKPSLKKTSAVPAKKTAPAAKKATPKKKLKIADPTKVKKPAKKVDIPVGKESSSTKFQRKLYKKYKNDVTKIPGYDFGKNTD